MLTVVITVKYDAASSEPMDEEQIVSQMRTIISAGYETVSAIVAVSEGLIIYHHPLIAATSGCCTKLRATQISKHSSARR